MHKILLVVNESNKLIELRTALDREGFSCVIADANNKKIENIIDLRVDLAVIDLDSSSNAVWTESSSGQIHDIKIENKLPVVVLISKKMVQGFISQPPVDDFVVEPYDFSELIIRIRRILNRESSAESGEIIDCGDLIIDIAKCEVYLRSRLLSLTFTEYELLKFLARNKGRVFTRDALLNEVWGYDYYGGDRTVDVHIRRLRNKIEDQDHVFIETVRNIAYKFKEASACNKNLT